MDFSVFGAGMMMGLSLIVAIGAQNAFVLRQGLLGNDVFWVCLCCAVSDAVLITIGVTSFRAVSRILPWIEPLMRFGGAAFLIWCGAKSFLSALRSTEALTVAVGQAGSVWRTIAACLAITWLNPHVYLDTVVLLGTISTQFDGHQTSFAAGAIVGSFLFFFALGYGAGWLRPIFARPISWRILEAMVAIVMWIIAARLVFQG